MAKFTADVRNGASRPAASAASKEAPEEAAAETQRTGPDVVTTVATIGAIGVVAAIVDVALIPGMVIGVVAAFAPKYAPKLGERLEPVFNSTVKGAYKLTKKARSAFAEAHEKVNDITAEVDAEEVAPAAEAAA